MKTRRPAPARLSGSARQADFVRFALERSFEFPVEIRLDMERAELWVKSPFAPSSEGASTLQVGAGFLERVRELASQLDTSAAPEATAGLDGSTWVIEVCRGARCRTRSLWTPREGPEYELGRLLFEQASALFPLGELY